MNKLENNRVVYYSLNDWAYSGELEKCINKLNQFEKFYNDIDIIDYCELKHILKYLDEKNENVQKYFNENHIDVKMNKGLICKLINNFKYNYSFKELEKWQENNTYFEYIKEYIEYIFDKNIINSDIIKDMWKLSSNPINLVFEELIDLENKGKLENKVKELKILDILLVDDTYINFLIGIIDNVKMKLDTKIFKGYEEKFLKMIEDFLNKIDIENIPFNWDLIYNSKKKIYTPEIKYFAEQKKQKYWDNYFNEGNGHSMGGARFAVDPKIKDVEVKFKNNEFYYAYNPNFALALTNTHQNSLSIFYFFEFLSKTTGNFSDIIKKTFFTGISDIFYSRKNDYVKNNHEFNLFYNQRIFQVDSYIKILKQKNIVFEKQLAHYIEVYLPTKYGLKLNVESDLDNLRETNSYNYKCRIMCTMIESICNQYKEIVNKGDFDLDFLIKYGIFDLRNMKASGIKGFRLLKNANISMYNEFFHNQSSLYQYEEKCDFYAHVLNNRPLYSKMIKGRKWIKDKLDLLIEQHLITTKDDIINIVNKEKILTMKLLLEEESLVISPNFNEEIINELLEEGEIVEEDNLFSSKELDYLNYHLNNKQFDDSLALRNKYQHNGHTGNIDMDYYNYLILLKILILILLRIDQDQELAMYKNNN